MRPQNENVDWNRLVRAGLVLPFRPGFGRLVGIYGKDVEVDLPGRNVEEDGSGLGTLLASSTDSEIDTGKDRSKSVSDEDGTESDLDDVGLDDVKNEDLFPLSQKMRSRISTELTQRMARLRLV
ncbi:hypothetical protein U1Q18_040498 [Sarracenia purpurea var. burkii]